MSYELATWIIQELEKRHWSVREAARKMDISHTSLNDLVNNQVRASVDMCKRLAQIFKVPVEFVFRKAGLLPPEPEYTSLEKEVVHLLRELSPERRQYILTTMRALATGTPAPRSRPAEP